MPGSSSRVPLVRCPKCGHLLPELPPYSVYCCGSCGAYLRAEKGSSVDDVLSENSGERISEGFERGANAEIFGIERGRRDEMPAASTRPRVGKSVRSRYGDGSVRKSNSGDSDARSNLSGRSMDGVVRKPPLSESGLDGHGKSPARSVPQGFRQSPLVGEFDEQRSTGSDFVDNYEEMEARDKVGAWFDHVKEDTGGYANRLVAQKGPSNTDEWLHYEASVDESELNRSRVPPRGRRADHFVEDMEPGYEDSYVRRRMEVPHDDWVHGSVRGSDKATSVRQRIPVYPDEGPSNYPPYHGYNYSRSPRHYQESYAGSSSLQNVGMNRAELFDLYNDLKEQLSITGDLPEDPIRRGHHRISSAGHYGGPNEYVLDEPLRVRRPTASVDLDDRAMMRPHYVNRTRLPVPPSRFVQREREHPFYDDDPSWSQTPVRTQFHPQQSPRHTVDSSYDSFVHRRKYPDYPRHTGPRLPYSSNHGLSSQSRSSVGSKSDGGSSAKDVNKKTVAVDENQRVLYPVIGAAPFVICYNCSQLLRLPKKLNSLKKTQYKLQCGSCLSIISFEFKNKSHSPTKLQLNLNSTVVHDEPSRTSESGDRSTHSSSVGIRNRESVDFSYSFPSTDSSMQLENKKPFSFEAQKQPGLGLSSSNATKSDPDLENSVRINNIRPRPPPGSPLLEHLEYSALFSLKRPDEIEGDVQGYDMRITDTNSTSLNYAQNAVQRGDLDFSPRSPGLGDASTNNDKGGNKKVEFFFAGITGSQRSPKELSAPPNALSTKDGVVVNGKALAQREVKRAEKMAGPISPGNYWYDSRAGFWGIIGSSCLGIIPPFIEEFGSPMPVDCAGGNTGICVNGRELHEKDLELLSTRGLPRTSNKSYVIDISGKVEDEETGDVVARLGKLAPTVEKTGRGFGMQPPERRKN